MNPIIVGVSGFAGSGKDTVADILVEEFGFVKVALADPLKRVLKDVYDFSDDQLWGPSQKRNAPDERYPREHTIPYNGPNYTRRGKTEEEHRRSMICVCCGYDAGAALLDGTSSPPCYLTPRYALQLLGTEWGRHCFSLTWVQYAIRTAQQLLQTRVTAVEGFGESSRAVTIFPNHYDFKKGLFEDSGALLQRRGGVVIPDIRFINEVNGLNAADAVLIRVRRKGYENPAYDHPSETEQTQIPDSSFNFVLKNEAGLAELRRDTKAMQL